MLQNLVIAVGPPVMPWSCELPRASYRIGQPLRHSAALVSESLIWTRVITVEGCDLQSDRCVASFGCPQFDLKPENQLQELRRYLEARGRSKVRQEYEERRRGCASSDHTG